MLMSYRQLIKRIGLLAVAAVLTLQAHERPSIEFDNRSGEDALVRLVGPSSGEVSVPDSTTRTVAVRGGAYRIFIRYGQAGKYRYAKGESFSVAESATSVEQVSITLHRVVGGNYGTSPSSEAEFNNSK